MTRRLRAERNKGPDVLKSFRLNRGLQTVVPLLVLLFTGVLLAAGCRTTGALGAPEPLLETATPAGGTSADADAPGATREPASTPVPATHVPPTATATQELARLPESPEVGAVAPSLTLPDLAGHEVTLRGLRGKPVLLNFWASW